MDIHIRKIQIVQDILSLQDEQILKGLESFLRKLRIEKAENKFHPMSLRELNMRIDKSESNFKNGKFKDAESLLNKYK